MTLPTDAEYGARVLAVGHILDVLCDCGTVDGASKATDPRDRSVILPHHFDCAAVEAWPSVEAIIEARVAAALTRGADSDAARGE